MRRNELRTSLPFCDAQRGRGTSPLWGRRKGRHWNGFRGRQGNSVVSEERRANNQEFGWRRASRRTHGNAPGQLRSVTKRRKAPWGAEASAAACSARPVLNEQGNSTLARVKSRFRRIHDLQEPGILARMQGLSSRAHAFSVEALVGKPCKRMKVSEGHDSSPVGDTGSDTNLFTGETQGTVAGLFLASLTHKTEKEKEKQHFSSHICTCKVSTIKPIEAVENPNHDYMKLFYRKKQLYLAFTVATFSILFKSKRKLSCKYFPVSSSHLRLAWVSCHTEEAWGHVQWSRQTDCQINGCWGGRAGRRGEQAEGERLSCGQRGPRRAAGLRAVEAVLRDRHRDDHHQSWQVWRPSSPAVIGPTITIL